MKHEHDLVQNARNAEQVGNSVQGAYVQVTPDLNGGPRATPERRTRSTGFGAFRLTEADVEVIRAEVATGITFAALAPRFGVSDTTIARALLDPAICCWQSMTARCYKPAANRYAYYGGRGIEVCDRWRSSFEAFIADMGPRPSRAHSIDRLDSEWHYEPGNCRWATMAEQFANRVPRGTRGLSRVAR